MARQGPAGAEWGEGRQLQSPISTTLFHLCVFDKRVESIMCLQ